MASVIAGRRDRQRLREAHLPTTPSDFGASFGAIDHSS
jgi:hypothetical protein